MAGPLLSIGCGFYKLLNIAYLEKITCWKWHCLFMYKLKTNWKQKINEAFTYSGWNGDWLNDYFYPYASGTLNIIM